MNTLEWLTQLIAFDTTSRYSNLELIQSVESWCIGNQLRTRLTHHSTEKKANLFASLAAANGDVNGGIILSGHTDVVPVDGQQWDSNPFKAVIKDNKVYGRGACDMKGFLAVILALIPRLKQMRLSIPIHFALSFDEEIGCLGVPLLIDDLKNIGIRPTGCIVGEPTNMLPVIAHKGKQSFRCCIHGKAAHSSLTTAGCNAIEYAAQLICFIREMAKKYKAQGRQDRAYDVPFTTLTTNLISGGNAYNTIPAFCEFIYEFRHLPEDSPMEIRQAIAHYIEEHLLPNMQQESADARIEIDTLAAAPGLDASETADIVQWVQAVFQDTEQRKVAYATEAGLFQQAEIPTIICGPGSIEQAHRANEYVELTQLEQCEKFILSILHGR